MFKMHSVRFDMHLHCAMMIITIKLMNTPITSQGYLSVCVVVTFPEQLSSIQYSIVN